MTTEAKLKINLKEMMKTKKLEAINVTALCKKCNIHRQTFYYHYTDIYDLIAAIFLTEDNKFSTYVFKNFAFLRSTYNSAARDLTDDFIFGKLTAVLLDLWMHDVSLHDDIVIIRKAARRFAHFVSDEFGFCFKDPQLTPASFRSTMTPFIDLAVSTMLPAVFELTRKEASSRERHV